MSSITYSDKIPNNVNLSEDRTLQRALEHGHHAVDGPRGEAVGAQVGHGVKRAVEVGRAVHQQQERHEQ